MSVQKMKFVTLTGPVDSYDQVVRQCIIDREFQPESVLQVRRGGRLQPLPGGNPAAPLLKKADELLSRLGLEPSYVPFSEELTVESVQEQLEALETQLNEMDQKMNDLRHEAAEQRLVITELEKLAELDVDLDMLRNLRHLSFHFGYLPQENYNYFQQATADRSDCIFIPTKTEDGKVYGGYFTPKSCEDAVDELFSSLHFTTIHLNDHIDGTAAHAVDELTHQVEDEEHVADDLENQEKNLVKVEHDHLLALRAWLCRENQVLDMRRYGAATRDTFAMMGWVPQRELASFQKGVADFGGIECMVDDADSTELTPPTKLKTGFLGRVFKPFLQMYGLPNYHEFDPSTFMAITYCLFFGIMFGDAGQGALLILFGLFMYKKKGMWLGRIISCCGVGSVIFGLVYGSVFGFEEWLPGFKILHGTNVLFLLIASLALGVILIGYVMVLNIMNGIRQKDPLKIFFGPNGLAGMIFYFGLIIAAVLKLLGVVDLLHIWYTLPVLVLPMLVIWLQEPLSELCEGKKPGPIGGYLVGGFFELFEALLSFLTNTLSFLRVAAYAITHVALMLVVHALAGSGNIVVLVLGNLFVMGLEAVMVCIQVLRLEFYELFGRFYQDSGREYTPKIIDYSTKIN